MLSNVLHIKENEVYPTYISKTNSNCEKKKNSSNGSEQTEKRLSLSSSKTLLGFLTGIASKHHGDFFCLICLHSFATKNKLESHENLSKNVINTWNQIKEITKLFVTV